MNSLMGERVVLREFRQEDISGIRSWVNDADTVRHMGGTFMRPQTWEESESYLSNILNGGAGGVNLVVADRETKRYLGQCALTKIDQTARHAELAIVLAPDSARRGYGREAVRLLLGFAFRQMNLNRVYLRVYAENERAVRCYEACGFRVEGRQREQVYFDGHYGDVLEMGVLRREFEA
ncbi:MAG: GNAT family N-acetyltransferase [Clostridia bacterium]|nr:GNAT family N-acetyltransferase [Clostridia bacterium]